MAARTPVIFIHGLWMHARSWDKWIDLFEKAGYDPVAPSWPGEMGTVEVSRKHPERFAGKGLEEITDHFAHVIRGLNTAPIVIGHSFGGLIVQKLLGKKFATAGIAIDPAQPKGVLRLPFAQLKSVFPILSKPWQLNNAETLSKRRFHKIFTNAISRRESDKLYDAYMVPTPNKPLFQVGFANLTPSSAASVDITATRGPLLIIGGGKDVLVPEVTARDTWRLYRKSSTVNDYYLFGDRGHSLVADSGWRDIADYCLAWLKKQALEPKTQKTALSRR